MNKLKSALVAVMILGACSMAKADFSFGVGTDNFYFSVGKYDYYPYGVSQGYAPRVNFYDVMSDYGYWVYAQPFGRVWRPYADARWRPYLYGHWTYTQYGPTWQGYEPWAWVGYHYGNWVLTPNYGWVWIPGYDWHAGHVAWSYGQDEIGWMPAPPPGYDYCRGYLHYHGAYNQFTYNDPYDYDDYGYNNRYDRYGYGNRYDDRYRDLYSGSSYGNISINLWVFINSNHYNSDNYADYYLDRNRTRDLFERRAVRINSQPFERSQIERITKQRITEVPVEVREVQTERKAVRVVIPQGEEEHIRKNANRVVQDVIKPGFEKEHKSFHGRDAQTEKVAERIFKVQPASREHARPAEENHVQVQDNNVKGSRRNDQFEDQRRQFPEHKELESRPEPKNDDRRFQEQKHVNVEPQKQQAQPNPDRYRYLGPPVRKDSDSRDRDFENNKTNSSRYMDERSRELENRNREREIEQHDQRYSNDRSRDLQPERERVDPRKGGDLSVEPQSDHQAREDRNVVKEDDSRDRSSDHKKQADSNDSEKDRKQSKKDKQKNHQDDSPNKRH